MTPRQMCVAALVALTLAPCLARSAAAQALSTRPNFSPASFMPAPIASAPARARLSSADDKAADLERPRPSILMTSLYATTALVQGLDAHSTLKAIDAGASERNPLMSYFTSHPPAFVALKAGAAAGLIFAGHRLARHNKFHAVVALVAIDSAYAIIAAHNYRVANRLR